MKKPKIDVRENIKPLKELRLIQREILAAYKDYDAVGRYQVLMWAARMKKPMEEIKELMRTRYRKSRAKLPSRQKP